MKFIMFDVLCHHLTKNPFLMNFMNLIEEEEYERRRREETFSNDDI
jgi:hypothetical protein